jgi:putative FmdB family regulatory protein
MPLYEYHCNQCHIDFEVRRSFSDTGTPECPVCRENSHVTRKFSAPAIVFKGSGFYVTDSRGKNAAGAPTKNHASSNGNGKSDTSESAPAAKNETKAKSETKAKTKSE